MISFHAALIECPPPPVKFQASHVPFAENEKQTWQDFHLNQHMNEREVRGSSLAQPVALKGSYSFLKHSCETQTPSAFPVF